MTDFTTNLHLALPDFNFSPWHDEMHDNFRIIDATINNLTGIMGVKGIWTNSTAYEIGDKVFDPDGSLWTSDKAFTSSPAPTTFAEERVSMADHWLPAEGTSSAILSAIAGLTPVADRLINFTGPAAVELLAVAAFGKALIATATVAAARTAMGLPTVVLDNRVPRFDGAAGAMQASGVSISDTDVLTAPGGLATSATMVSQDVTVVNSVQVGGDINYTSTNDFAIQANTVDGADDKRAHFAGGGLPLQSRGGMVIVHGNEVVGSEGRVRVIAGSAAAGANAISMEGATTFNAAITGTSASFSGTLAAATLNLTGNVNAVNGVFSGNVSGVAGTFSGTLTGATVRSTAVFEVNPAATLSLRPNPGSASGQFTVATTGNAEAAGTMTATSFIGSAAGLTNIGTPIAAQAVGGVGTYAFCRATGAVAAGGTTAGANLTYTGASGDTNGGNPGGTWRAMGASEVGSNGSLTTLWLRIA